MSNLEEILRGIIELEESSRREGAMCSTSLEQIQEAYEEAKTSESWDD